MPDFLKKSKTLLFLTDKEESLRQKMSEVRKKAVNSVKQALQSKENKNSEKEISENTNSENKNPETQNLKSIKEEKKASPQ